MLTESFGLEAKHGDPDCRSTGFHQKKWENTNVCGRELKIHMRVCVYSCTCAPQEHIYTDFQRGENLPSYKRQMSWHASIARAVLAHFWHWLPCVLVEGNLGCQMPMGPLCGWCAGSGSAPAWMWWHSSSMPTFCQLPWQLHIVCTFTGEIQWVLDTHLRKELWKENCKQESLKRVSVTKNVENKPCGRSYAAKKVLEMGAGKPLGLGTDP